MIESRKHANELLASAHSRLETVEQRVHRLEDALSALQDTRQLEDRLTERVTERLHQECPVAAEAPPLIIDAARKPAGALTWLHPTSHALPALPGHGQPWLLFDVATEARVILHMFFDPRYRLGWGVRSVTLGLIGALVITIWLPGGFPIIGPLLMKATDLVLAFILFKILNREVRRYRATFPDLFPPHAP